MDWREQWDGYKSIDVVLRYFFFSKFYSMYNIMTKLIIVRIFMKQIKFSFRAFIILLLWEYNEDEGQKDSNDICVWNETRDSSFFLVTQIVDVYRNDVWLFVDF